MDNRNSPKFNPDDMEMVGNQIEIELGHSVISLFRTRISRFEHVTGDPRFDCTVYTRDNSYEDCIRRDLKETFQNIIECQPPPFAYDLNNTCDQKLNLSHGKLVDIDSMFRHLYWKDFRSHCKTPCSKSKYTTRLSSTNKIPFPKTIINIIFDQKLDVARSRFSINGNTFLMKLGGLIGVGRTLLWILVSLLGAVQVTTPHNNHNRRLYNFF